jgi:general secretion pathway protein C
MIPIRPFIHGLNLFLLTALAYVGVNTVYDVGTRKMVKPIEQTAEGVAARPDEAIRSRPLSYYQVISQRDLFDTGKKKASAPAPELEIQKLEPTKLKLKLWGTITHRGGKEYAVIENLKDRSQDLYKAGDTIEGANVKQVMREKVVLTVAGRDEILEMEVASTSSTAGPAPRAAAARQQPAQAQSQQVPISREDIQEASSNIQQLMRQVRIRPHFERGKPAGLMLSGVQPDSLFTQMGLKSGDVLQGIEGKPIRSMNDVLKLYEQLGSADAVAIDVKRGGSRLNIQYEIE